MSCYNHHLHIRIPASLYDIGRAVGRAMDPDRGGAESFGPKFRRDTPEGPEYAPDHYDCETPCTEEFHAQAHAMLHDAALLHAVVTADYAARWPDLTAPTLAECQSFVAGCEIVEPEISPTPASELYADIHHQSDGDSPMSEIAPLPKTEGF